jgi:hypothetical protein
MQFLKTYIPDFDSTPSLADVSMLDHIEFHATGMQQLLSTHGGATFDNGVYRLFKIHELEKWTAVAVAMFPHLRKKIVVFGSNWRGELFAVGLNRKHGDQYLVQLLDPASSQSLNIPATFAAFHDVELVDYPNDTLHIELFQEWLSVKRIMPKAHECVGYIRPLMLGGVDSIPNQEITDLEVYWSFNTHVKRQTDGLPAGTKIDEVDLE